MESSLLGVLFVGPGKIFCFRHRISIFFSCCCLISLTSFSFGFQLLIGVRVCLPKVGTGFGTKDTAFTRN